MGLTLSQLKTYTAGVLNAWLPNRNVLSQFEQKDKDVITKLDNSEDGKTLLYNGKPIEGGGGGGYGKRITVLFNGDESILESISSVTNGLSLSLPQAYTNFTTLRITVRYNDNNTYTSTEVSVDLLDSLPRHASINNVSDGGITIGEGIVLFKMFTDDNKKIGFVVDSPEAYALIKVEGIFWEEAKIGRKLYTLYDMKEATKAIYSMEPDNQPEWGDDVDGVYTNNHFPGYIIGEFDFRLEEDGGMHPFMELPSVEDYDSIIISVQYVYDEHIGAAEEEMTDEQKESFYPIFPNHFGADVYEIPVDLIKENYGSTVAGMFGEYDLKNIRNNEWIYRTVHTFGWIDKTHFGVGMSYNTTGVSKRINKIYGVKYETVTSEVSNAQVSEAIADTVSELNAAE